MKFLQNLKIGKIIFNVGEGLTPDLDPEKIKIFLKTLRSLNSQ